MKRDRHRAAKLIDIGSTTAISAMVEIVSNGSAAGILTRQVMAMLDRLERPEDQGFAIEGFCDELQSFIESVPGARRAAPGQRTAARRGRTA